MATPGDLVLAMADTLGLPHATVVVYDRYLAAAGLRSKSGRGWSAARVTARDAANLLIAILASGQVKDAVASVRRYEQTQADDGFAGVGISRIAALVSGHSFVDAVEALFGAAAAGDLISPEAVPGPEDGSPPTLLSISALTPGTLGEIRIAASGKGASRSVRYLQPDPWRRRGGRKPPASEVKAWEREQQSRQVQSDFEQYRRVSERAIIRIAALLNDRKE